MRESPWGYPDWDRPPHINAIERKVYVVEDTGSVYLADDEQLTDHQLSQRYNFPTVFQHVQGYFRSDEEAVEFLKAHGIRVRRMPIPAHAPSFQLEPAA